MSKYDGNPLHDMNVVAAALADGRRYPDVDHGALGEHFIRHMDAMTGEGLHAKSDIAAQLGWRDLWLKRLAQEVKLAEDILADSEVTDMELLLARRDVQHWKANHDNQVRRARVLTERLDMPLERVAAYEQIGQLQDEVGQLRGLLRRALLPSGDSDLADDIRAALGGTQPHKDTHLAGDAS